MDNLSFVRFRKLTDLLLKMRGDEARERMIDGAWVGFQMGAGGELNFGDYLRKMGLVKGEDAKNPVTKETTAKEAIAGAEAILAMASKKKDKT